jgi:hypothetical protein
MRHQTDIHKCRLQSRTESLLVLLVGFGLGLGLQWWMVDDCKIGDKIGKESSGLVLCAWVMNAVLGFDFMWWI